MNFFPPGFNPGFFQQLQQFQSDDREWERIDHPTKKRKYHTNPNYYPPNNNQNINMNNIDSSFIQNVGNNFNTGTQNVGNFNTGTQNFGTINTGTQNFGNFNTKNQGCTIIGDKNNIKEVGDKTIINYGNKEDKNTKRKYEKTEEKQNDLFIKIHFDILETIQLPNSTAITVLIDHRMNDKVFKNTRIFEVSDFNSSHDKTINIVKEYFIETVTPPNYFRVPLSGVIKIPEEYQLEIVISNRVSSIAFTSNVINISIERSFKEEKKMDIFEKEYKNSQGQSYFIKMILNKIAS